MNKMEVRETYYVQGRHVLSKLEHIHGRGRDAALVDNL